jgi:hypothetical protein
MLDLSHYSKEIDKIDNFNEWKDKVQKYCENDCIALFQIITKFRKLIINRWSIDIKIYPTVPSLAFAVYITHYLKDNKIPITSGEVFEFIRESFTGGSTEMYIPQSLEPNQLVYSYDVNSLYPDNMLKNKFPIGNIMQFEGDPTILPHSNYY